MIRGAPPAGDHQVIRTEVGEGVSQTEQHGHQKRSTSRTDVLENYGQGAHPSTLRVIGEGPSLLQSGPTSRQRRTTGRRFRAVAYSLRTATY